MADLQTSPTRPLPPVWLMGLTNATFGFTGGFSVITLPEMLAAQGVPGGRIAAVLSPGFFIFLFSPLLNVRFSRRTWSSLRLRLGPWPSRWYIAPVHVA